MKKHFLSISVVIIAATIAIIIMPFMYEIEFDEHTCPFCYGQDFCDKKNVTLRMSSVSDIINNLFSVKNVYFTTNGLVLKKLGHQEDINMLDQHICELHGENKDCELNNVDGDLVDYMVLLRAALGRAGNGYRICGNQSIDIIAKRLFNVEHSQHREWLVHLWTISLINFEVLFYKLFREQLGSLPTYYGACGRVIAVENGGRTLSDFVNAAWITRATIAKRIIELAMMFTAGDEDFRIYLTDVSPDNIVVDETTLETKFVDFGNIILVQKSNVSSRHESRYYSDPNGFAFSETDICGSSISDHNFYSVCKLLFSYNAPWPMMNGGLLHSIPDEIQSKATLITELIESCVKPTDKFDRFESIAKLNVVLKEMLTF